MYKFFLSLVPISFVLISPAQKSNFNDTTLLQPVEIKAVRADEKTPVAKTNISSKDLEKNNTGRDLPFMLNQLPSTEAFSDAGNGVGYTGIRIRGTDASRINVTLNGIPYNDAEGQGTFFVDLPDIISSAGSIQVQRGSGTSSNGTGAFGAAINISTNELKKDFFASLNNSGGSFNTFKNTFQFGSGLLDKHTMIEGRLSRINSDGYMDRASTHLSSAYGSIAWADSSRSFRLNIFTGNEKTYQAWYGVPENQLLTNRTFNPAGMDQPGKPYENETDNYQQTHYQFFFNQKINTGWKFNGTLFFTKGWGYYEQYKAGQRFNDYGLPDYFDGTQNISETDLIRRLWLDNNFYGGLFSFLFKNAFSGGAGWNQYDGIHYGEVIWSKVKAIPVNYHWYDLTAKKTEFSSFIKWSQPFNEHWQSYADMQFRNVLYSMNGFEANPTLIVDKNFGFFNPKAGLIFSQHSWQAYASIAAITHEPNRDDFEAGKLEQPVPETLYDMELSIEKKKSNYALGANFYYMKYKNQLILTGKINNVGAYTRINIPNSYRMGIEFTGQVSPLPDLDISGNLSLSSNKIKNFTEYLDDYDNGGQQTKFYPTTDISFSPSVMSSFTVEWRPVKKAEIRIMGKYCGQQYLDNTSNLARRLHPYYIQDVQFLYTLEKK